MVLAFHSPVQAVDGDPGIPFRDPDWSQEDEVWDVAVSADGSVVVVSVFDELIVYDSSGNILWTWSDEDYTVTAVDISDDGNVVVAAILIWWYWIEIEPQGTESLRVANSDFSGTQEDDGMPFSVLLYWKNAKNLTDTPDPDWSSEELWGPISQEALAVSSNGDQVVVVGTGPNVFYWNGALSRSGVDEQTTWNDNLGYQLEHVKISDDGDTVAILGYTWGFDDANAYVYKNCTSRTGVLSTDFNLTYFFNLTNLDYFWDIDDWISRYLAMSDDGNYVVIGLEDMIYFFSTDSSDGWNPLWTCQLGDDEWVAGVDISEDGNTVVAVTNTFEESPTSLSIFHGATSKTDPVTPNYEFTGAEFYTDEDYFDVSLDNAGELAVAGTGDYLFAVNATNGEPLWYYNGSWPDVSMMVRVSEDGNAVVSAGSEMDTLYYFSLEEEPPPEPEPEPPKAVGGILLASEVTTFLGTLVVALSAAALALVIAVRRKQL
ncbi:MAG: hypothetical protein QFX35_05285 [Candidatus Verstraetearchaeota archaeon]|nr:hypothetical protein [Candidatus Verstraetearchaeota archaeon]